jgi:ubiquinone/menaquinone biosynthesis C-methylase UbiE
MGFWERRVVPRLVDLACGAAEIRPWREQACAGLQGRVLEIGFGSGLNVDLYPDTVTTVAAIEPSDRGWALSERRRGDAGVPIERSGLDGQRLSEADASADSALCTFALCTIPDAAAALHEVRRVLVNGGRFHFLEHGLAPDAGVQTWQRRLDPLQGRLFGGCHLTRDIPALLEDAGFEVEQIEQRYLPGPAIGRPWSYGSVGVAVARS